MTVETTASAKEATTQELLPQVLSADCVPTTATERIALHQSNTITVVVSTFTLEIFENVPPLRNGSAKLGPALRNRTTTQRAYRPTAQVTVLGILRVAIGTLRIHRKEPFVWSIPIQALDFNPRMSAKSCAWIPEMGEVPHLCVGPQACYI